MKHGDKVYFGLDPPAPPVLASLPLMQSARLARLMRSDSWMSRSDWLGAKRREKGEGEGRLKEWCSDNQVLGNIVKKSYSTPRPLLDLESLQKQEEEEEEEGKKGETHSFSNKMWTTRKAIVDANEAMLVLEECLRLPLLDQVFQLFSLLYSSLSSLLYCNHFRFRMRWRRQPRFWVMPLVYDFRMRVSPPSMAP